MLEAAQTPTKGLTNRRRRQAIQRSQEHFWSLRLALLTLGEVVIREAQQIIGVCHRRIRRRYLLLASVSRVRSV
jgi:hypothetical protein